MTPTSPDTPSRRATNKALTRQRIIDAALALFSDRGYDDATVEDIARQSEISPRTFFRYFETKEQVLFFGLEDFVRLLVAAYRDQQPGGDDLHVLAYTVAELAPRLEPLADRIARYYLAIGSSVALRGRDRDERAAAEAAVSTAIAMHHGQSAANEDHRLTGALVMLLVQRSLDAWLASGCARPLAEFCHEETRRLTRVAGGAQPPK